MKILPVWEGRSPQEALKFERIVRYEVYRKGCRLPTFIDREWSAAPDFG